MVVDRPEQLYFLCTESFSYANDYRNLLSDGE
jgi:hypothetical protein